MCSRLQKLPEAGTTDKASTSALPDSFEEDADYDFDEEEDEGDGNNPEANDPDIDESDAFGSAFDVMPPDDDTMRGLLEAAAQKEREIGDSSVSCKKQRTE